MQGLVQQMKQQRQDNLIPFPAGIISERDCLITPKQFKTTVTRHRLTMRKETAELQHQQFINNNHTAITRNFKSVTCKQWTRNYKQSQK